MSDFHLFDVKVAVQPSSRQRFESLMDDDLVLTPVPYSNGGALIYDFLITGSKLDGFLRGLDSERGIIYGVRAL
jgi:hypothetical protein